MTKAHMPIPKDAVAQLCQRRHIRKLALYGSVLRDDFGRNSDVDVLVEFEPACVPGLRGLTRIERELTAIVGRQVDLRTPADLGRYFRQKAINEAEVHYVA